jgi:glycosyltransferase involved in cell wall biosynthesis
MNSQHAFVQTEYLLLARFRPTDMARIAVAHPHFDVRGGAEMVCLNVLAALQHDHDVVLFTAGDPDFSDLAQYYHIPIESVTVRDSPPLCAAVRAVVGERFGLLTYTLLNRHLNQNEDDFDLVVSTYNEVATDRPSVLYIHHPLYDRSGLGHDPRSTGIARNIYKALCERIAGISEDTIRSSTVLANSDWTGGVVNEIYGMRPRTVYPPVDTSEFSAPPLDEQEHGFVSIGRISPDKNILHNINIIEKLRERGHDIHLHLVGPTPRENYLETVKDRIEGHSFVSLETDLNRPDLVEMIQTHRYGLHGKEHEHFGIVVAELIAGGALPFIPDSGGQREIVDDRDELRYRSTEEAVEKIDRVLSAPNLEADIRTELPDINERFGRERFQNEISEVVIQSLKPSSVTNRAPNDTASKPSDSLAPGER